MAKPGNNPPTAAQRRSQSPNVVYVTKGDDGSTTRYYYGGGVSTTGGSGSSVGSGSASNDPFSQAGTYLTDDGLKSVDPSKVKGPVKGVYVGTKNEGRIEPSNPINVNSITPSNGQPTTTISRGAFGEEVRTAAPPRYNRPFWGAVGESARNVFNFGVIGQQGLGAYWNQATREPFEYVGTPKDYRVIGYTRDQNVINAAKGAGFFVRDDSTAPFVNASLYDIKQDQARKLFTGSSIDYKGQDLSIFGNQLYEKKASDLRVTYQEKINQDVEYGRAYYQGQIDTGQLSLRDAKNQFSKYSEIINQRINRDFQTEVGKKFSADFERLKPEYTTALKFKASYPFQTAAEPYIKGIETSAEIGALTAATAFSGTGGILAGTYLMGKTEYKANLFVNQAMTGRLTGQQLISGAADVGLSGAAAVATLNLGSLNYYSEWRNIRYQDVANSPAIVRGYQMPANENFNFAYEAFGKRQTLYGTSLTKVNVGIVNTGGNRAGFRVIEGMTKTSVYDPQYLRYVYSTESFSGGGKIATSAPNFLNVGLTGEGKNILGLGKGYYIPKGSGQYTEYPIYSVTREQDKYFNVISGKEGTKIYFDAFGQGRTNINDIKNIGSSGKIYKNFFNDDATYSFGSGRSGLMTKLKGVSSEAVNVLAANQRISIINAMASQAAPKLAPAVSSLQILESANRNIVNVQSGSALINEQRAVSSMLQGVMPALQEARTAVLPVMPTSGQGMLDIQQERALVTPINLQVPGLAQEQRQALKTDFGKMLTPGFVNPYVTTAPFIETPRGFKFPNLMNLNDLDLPSNIIRGGRRKTEYAPSFSAIIFNISGKAPKGVETGINFRPITKGFKFIRKRKF